MHRTWVALVAVLAVATACGKKKQDGDIDPRAAEGLATTFGALAAVEPSQKTQILAQGAFETVAPSMMCLKSYAAADTARARMEALFDCGLSCTPEAAKSLKGVEPRLWMSKLVAACSPDHFGVDDTSASLVSAEWFVIHKVGQLAASHAKGDGAGARKIAEAMAAARFELPLPAVAVGRYDLPVVPATASTPAMTRTFVLMGQKNLLAGAAPVATLGPAGPAIDPAFAGEEVRLEDLRAAVYKSVGEEPPPDAPRTREEAIEEARKGGLPRLAGPGGPLRPLVLADRTRPAREVIDAALSLDGPLLAVASADDPGARALRVSLTRSPPANAVRASAVEVTLGDAGASVDLYPPSGDAVEVSRAAEGVPTADLAAAVKSVRGRAGAPQDEVVLRVDPTVPWHEAALAAAVLVDSGAPKVWLTNVPHNDELPGPIAEFAELGTTGDLDKDAIRRVMKGQEARVRACYEGFLRVKPDLAGILRVEINIAPDGSVTSARASGMNHPELEDCVARSTRQLKFGKTVVGPVRINYPYVFKPSK